MHLRFFTQEPLIKRFKYAVARAVTEAAVFGIGLFREIQWDELDEWEAGTRDELVTKRAVFCSGVGRSPWWLVMAWIDEGNDETRHCFNMRVLSHHIEIHYHRKGHREAHSQ